jgi:hypothetical protein
MVEPEYIIITICLYNHNNGFEYVNNVSLYLKEAKVKHEQYNNEFFLIGLYDVNFKIDLTLLVLVFLN